MSIWRICRSWIHVLASEETTYVSKRFRYATHLRDCIDIHKVKHLHEQITKDGYDRETYLGNLLVDIYSRFGSLGEATQVFDRIYVKNLFTWTIIISAYARNGLNRESLGCFRKMCSEGILPDRVTFATVVGACTALGDMVEGKALHSLVVNANLDWDPVLQVALLNMYGKAGDLTAAEGIFQRLEMKSPVSYTAMIVAYTQSGKHKVALALYRNMHLEGVKPDKVTFLSILGACTNLQDGEEVHVSISYGGIEDDDLVASALIHMYGRCQSVERAYKVFNNTNWLSVQVWNSMISAYTQNEHYHEALKLYKRMELEGVVPDEVTTVEILGVCSELKEIKKGRVIHEQLQAREIEKNVKLVDTLLNMYRECGSIEDAARVFHELADKGSDPVAWNTIIAAYAENGKPEKALAMYHSMNIEGVEPTDVTFVAVVAACTALRYLAEGKLVHDRILFYGYESLAVVSNSLMQLYGTCNQFKDAKHVFDGVHHKDEVSWNTIMGLYLQDGEYSEVLRIFYHMELEGVKPNDMTFIHVLGTCRALAKGAYGKSIHSRITLCGRERQTAIGSALIDMYGKLGLLDVAVSVFETITHKNTVSWNSLIAGFGQQGQSRDAVDIFQQMRLEGFEPDSATFLIVLFTCSHGGLVEEALWCFADLMEEESVKATEEHYGCLIDLLSRAGWLDKAEDLIKNMPLEPDSASWMSLLGGCKLHGDLHRGGIVMESAESGNDSAPYVVLSNIFTA